MDEYLIKSKFDALPEIVQAEHQSIFRSGIYDVYGEIIGRNPGDKFKEKWTPVRINPIIDFEETNNKDHGNDNDDGDDEFNNDVSNIKMSCTGQLLRIFEKSSDCLFHDGSQEPYAIIKNNFGYSEIVSCKSNSFKSWLAQKYWKNTGKTLNNNVLSSAITTLQGRALYEGKKINLYNRVAWCDGFLWYDLGGPDTGFVRINSNGWEITDKNPILFRRYSHQKSQVNPIKGGNSRDLFEFINISDSDNKNLLLVWLICCFIPGFPHPILNIYGPQGSAKSFLCKLLRRLIDPSMLEVLSFPRETDFAQVFQHHWFLPFDNISYLSTSSSDLLCKAVTGDGFSKRVLFTDDDDKIYSFQRCLAINGINIIGIKPDLLERSILLELDRIPEEKRKSEAFVLKEFDAALPFILGSIFDVLSKALAIKDTVIIEKLPRMADFAQWGCAIADAIEIGRENFLRIYRKNIDEQNNEVLNQDLIAQMICQFMQDKDDWTGTPTQLHAHLREYLPDGMEKDRSWPKRPNSMSQRINCIKPNLCAAGLVIQQFTENKQRMISIRKTSSPSLLSPQSRPSTDKVDIFNL